MGRSRSLECSSEWEGAGLLAVGVLGWRLLHPSVKGDISKGSKGTLCVSVSVCGEGQHSSSKGPGAGQRLDVKGAVVGRGKMGLSTAYNSFPLDLEPER